MICKPNHLASLAQPRLHLQHWASGLWLQPALTQGHGLTLAMHSHQCSGKSVPRKPAGTERGWQAQWEVLKPC